MEEKGEELAFGDGAGWVRGSVIGRGGFGCVYLAKLRNPKSKHRCLPPVMAVKSAEVSISGSIQKEREILSNLKGCPNLIKCFGEETTMADNGMLVYNLLLEYGSGGTLADRIKKSGGSGLPAMEARVYARSILRGLAHIHSNGYVHCDLKPENVLLVRNYCKVENKLVAKIGDFGLAKRGNESKKKRRLEPYWRGTPMYLSPEAVIDRVQEAPCDVWALGCVVLEMLTGKPPWDGGKEIKPEEILRRIESGDELPKVPDGVSKEARDFLKGCFVRKPVYRWTSEMLLFHSFVKGLDGEQYDWVEESGEVVDLDEIESMELVFDDDLEHGDGLSADEWNGDSVEDTFLYEERVADVYASSLVEEKECWGNDSSDFYESREQYPVSFTISA